MSETLAELRSAVTGLARRFDAHLLSQAEARRALHDATAIKNAAAVMESLAAARVAESCDYRREGFRSPAEQIAKETGTSLGAAIDALKMAERLEELPGLDAAARRGEVSPQQAASIADAASVAPEAEQRLVAEAKALPLRELQARCATTKAERVDREQLRARAHRNRCVRKWQDPDGTGHFRTSGPADVIEQMWARIEAEKEKVFAKARVDGRVEPSEAYAFDALQRLVCGEATSAGARVKVIARTDLGPLVTGEVVPGDVCDLAGVAVAPSVIRDLLASGSGFLAAVVTQGEALAGVAHCSRRPTATQDSALQWLYPTCAAEGCSQSVRLERDHRVDWAATKFTLLDFLDLLCPHHHGLKTTKGWGLVEGRGKRAFVPPDDLRHPQHAPPAA